MSLNIQVYDCIFIFQLFCITHVIHNTWKTNNLQSTKTEIYKKVVIVLGRLIPPPPLILRTFGRLLYFLCQYLTRLNLFYLIVNVILSINQNNFKKYYIKLNFKETNYFNCFCFFLSNYPMGQCGYAQA